MSLVHSRAQQASCNQQQNTTFISSHACSRGDDTGDPLQLHKARTKAHASSMPVHSRCSEIKNKSFISIDACSWGDDRGDTLQQHKTCTKGRASSMPVHSWCYIINNKTQNSSPVMHATKSTAHTARTWPWTTMICNACVAIDPQYTYPYPYYAHTIYVPPTYPWSVSTRGGHGIPKYSLCPSIIFLYHLVRPSVSVFF